MLGLIDDIRETWDALKLWPDSSQWIAAAKVAVPALAVIAAIGFLSGWIEWRPIDSWSQAPKIALILLFIPAFLEEIVFRGVLLSWLATYWRRWAAWISTLLFVAWHPLQALAFGPPWSSLFLNPGFLFATLILGMVLSHIRIRSGSLWPVILVHWIAVLVWKILLGGPFY